MPLPSPVRQAFDALHEGMGDPLEAALAIHRRLFERDSDPYRAVQAGQRPSTGIRVSTSRP